MFINKDIHPKLKDMVRFFWFAYGSLDNDNAKHLLLPMDHSDMIIGCEWKYYYESDGQVIVPDQVVFHGIRRKPISLIQEEYNETFGISFEPWGLYPFINDDMSFCADKIISLSDVDTDLYNAIRNAVPFENDAETKMQTLCSKVEEILLSHLKLSDSYIEAVKVMKAFYEGDYSNIEEFCTSNVINRRSLQRYFNKYVGVSPKELLQIRQFEDTSRDLLYQNEPVLSDVVFRGLYYDQAHFNKSFKKFSHHTPKEFKTKQPAFKSKLNIDS